MKALSDGISFTETPLRQSDASVWSSLEGTSTYLMFQTAPRRVADIHDSIGAARRIAVFVRRGVARPVRHPHSLLSPLPSTLLPEFDSSATVRRYSHVFP